MSKITFADNGGSMEADPYIGFKKFIGGVIIISTLLYGILVTVLVILFGSRLTVDQLLWSFVNTITSSMMGWCMAKASTVFDNMFGNTQSSERKTANAVEAAKRALSNAAETVKALAAAKTESKPIDPLHEAHEYKKQTAATVVKAEIAAENAIDNVEELKK